MDRNYWDSYYREHGTDLNIRDQSSFAVFCLEKYFVNASMTIIELGSGNGRDAIYFAHHGHNIMAIDQSVTAIDIEKSNIHADVSKNITTILDDFINFDYNRFDNIDVIYSRFTLHAISKEDEVKLLPKIYECLPDNSLFCIEVRTIKDPLYGVGTDCGNNAFRTDHYRRFIDSNVFLMQMLDLGFNLVFFTEENNLSIYKNDNPVLMRAVFRK